MTIQFAAPKRPKAEGYGAKMGSDWFRLAAGPDHPVAITTRDSLAERFDQKASAFENVLDVGYAFSRNNLTGGEGLDWYPRISQTGQVLDIDAIRFWDSANINIDPPDRGQKYRASLTRQTQIFWTPPNPPVDMSESEQFIYVAHGDTLTWFDGWNDNTVIPGQSSSSPASPSSRSKPLPLTRSMSSPMTGTCGTNRSTSRPTSLMSTICPNLRRITSRSPTFGR